MFKCFSKEFWVLREYRYLWKSNLRDTKVVKWESGDYLIIHKGLALAIDNGKINKIVCEKLIDLGVEIDFRAE